MKNLLAIFLIIPVFNLSFSQEEKNLPLNVAVLIYDGVEILDFSGPSEVFSASTKQDLNGKHQMLFNVYLVAAKMDTIISQGFIRVIPNYTIKDSPKPDIIVLPGGSTKKTRENKDVIDWVKQNAKRNITLMSVCTGAFILGDAGLLDNKTATTWYGAISRLQEQFPKTKVMEETRFVDNGNIVTTAGVSAGIDGALHIVERLFGIEVASNTAKYMEYDKWVSNSGITVN